MRGELLGRTDLEIGDIPKTEDLRIVGDRAKSGIVRFEGEIETEGRSRF